MKHILVILFGAFLVSPALAGKDKTMDAWNYTASRVAGSISAEPVKKQISDMTAQMRKTYNRLDRYGFYGFASKMFDELAELSKNNGGKKVSKPGWLN